MAVHALIQRFRGGWLVLGVLLALPLHAGEGTWIRGIYTGKSPRPVTLSTAHAWRVAAEKASYLSHAFVLEGDGDSMQPLYPPGTILVLQPVRFDQLERGQTVLYRDRDNHLVAHVLVAKARDGWRICGLNNRIHDMEPVHAGNFVGVVVAAYSPLAEGSALGLALR
jgi:hypothetical protein